MCFATFYIYINLLFSILVKEEIDLVEGRRNSLLNDSSDSLSYRLNEPKDSVTHHQILSSGKSKSNDLLVKRRKLKKIQNKIVKRQTQRKRNLCSFKESSSELPFQKCYTTHSRAHSSCIFTRSRSHESASFSERILRSHARKESKFKNKFFTFENVLSKADTSSISLPVKKSPSRNSRKIHKVKDPPNLDIAEMPNISVYSDGCSKIPSGYECRRSSLIMTDPPILTPIEIKNESNLYTSDKKSETLEVKTNSNLCSKGCLKLTVRVRSNSTDSDHSNTANITDVTQQYCNLHNDITVQSKGMVYEIIPVKCDGIHDSNENLVAKMNSSVAKSKKNVQCPSAPDTVNIRISSPCYSHSLTDEEPELSLDSPMKPGTKRVRLILGKDSIDIDIPPSKHRKCI